MYKYLTIALLSLATMGCQSTSDSASADDCINNNWQDIGYDTATSGQSVRHFNSYIEQCGDKLAKDAKSTYLDGFEKGIKEYCTYDNGYKVASNSKPNNNTCPFELRAEFESGYKVAAVKLADTKAKMNQISEDVEEKKRTYTRWLNATNMGQSK